MTDLPDMPELDADDSEWDRYARPGEARAKARNEALADGFLPYINGADWIGKPPPPREWLWETRIPLRQTTYLTGPGSAGKSLFAQQLATCVGAPSLFLGERIRPMRTIYITCEDSEEELIRRQHAICEATGVPFDWLMAHGEHALMSLAGVVGNALMERNAKGNWATTDRFDMLVDNCLDDCGASPLFLILDNASHFFSGDENNRQDVTAFLNALNKLCMDHGTTIMLVGHPNKSGDDYSGSTAWQNAVRHHLVLKRPDDETDAQDEDLRILSNAKSNYARHGEELRMLWHRWAFVAPDSLPKNMILERAASARVARENELFMQCLAACTKARRAVSHSPSSNYAPKVFASMPEAKRLKQPAFEQAMERLIHLGKIELDVALWQGTNRHWKTGIRAVENLRHTPAPDTCVTPELSDCNSLRQTAPNTHPISKDIEGAPPSGSGAPLSDETPASDEQAPIPQKGGLLSHDGPAFDDDYDDEECAF